FLIDVDPPWRRLTIFLEKMRAAHPNARALVIGAAVPNEIVAVRAQSGALQFIEKPFDLAAFGAAVQALLGPWRDKEGRGMLRETTVEIAEAPEPETIQIEAGKKIVVVDDTEMLLIFVEDILSNAEPEWQISTALSATEGLEKIQNILPDLVLLDYSLPDFNG